MSFKMLNISSGGQYCNNQAQQGRLVTFVVPTNANTGYGYIKSMNKGGAYNIEFVGQTLKQLKNI